MATEHWQIKVSLNINTMFDLILFEINNNKERLIPELLATKEYQILPAYINFFSYKRFRARISTINNLSRIVLTDVKLIHLSNE